MAKGVTIMKKKILITVILCALIVAIPDTASPAGQATRDDAVQMVEMAGRMIEVMGDAALAVISDPYGRCCDRERSLFVFVYSEDVVLLADSTRHDVIGVSFKGKDPIANNYRVSEIMVKTAMKEGSGWVDYPYMNPATSQITEMHTYAKLFRHAGKNYIVCCGTWNDEPREVTILPVSDEYTY